MKGLSLGLSIREGLLHKVKCALSSTGQTKDEFKRAITSLPAGLPGEATGEAVLSPLPSRSWL